MDGEMGIEKAILIKPEGHAVSLLDTMDDILGKQMVKVQYRKRDTQITLQPYNRSRAILPSPI